MAAILLYLTLDCRCQNLTPGRVLISCFRSKSFSLNDWGTATVGFPQAKQEYNNCLLLKLFYKLRQSWLDLWFVSFTNSLTG